MGPRSTANHHGLASSRGAFQPFAHPQPGGVLVVDDDPEVRETMDVLLTGAGFEVQTAADGAEALELLRTLRPALILLDINMPMMDGAEFREAQRRDRELIRIPTVVMTGGDVHPLLDLAVEQTMRKPVCKADLLAIVRQHCLPA